MIVLMVNRDIAAHFKLVQGAWRPKSLDGGRLREVRANLGMCSVRRHIKCGSLHAGTQLMGSSTKLLRTQLNMTTLLAVGSSLVTSLV